MVTSPISGRKVCVVDDDASYREFLSILLGGLDARVREAGSGAELFTALGQEKFDCILLDYHLEDESGLSLLDMIVSRFDTPPPVVMLTGTENQRTIIKAFRCGASDYVLKRSLRADELLTAIGKAIARQERQLASHRELERLRETSGLDEVTGLPSLAAMEARMEEIAATSERAFGVILVAFNEYPIVAQRFGTIAAEKALRTFARQLRDAGRRSDICGRHKAGEFIYLIDVDASPETVAGIAERLQQALSFSMDIEAASLNVSAAIGAALRGRDGDDGRALIAAAAQALTNASSPITAREASTPLHEPETSDASALKRTEDRRGERRQRVLKQARIVSRDPFLSLSCTIRDQSNQGARLRIESLINVPASFELYFVSSSVTKRVRKIWQVGKELGVEFQAD